MSLCLSLSQDVVEFVGSGGGFSSCPVRPLSLAHPCSCAEQRLAGAHLARCHP